MNDLNANDWESEQHRLAYLAAEGAFFLRHLVGLDIGDEKWSSIFRDIEKMED